MSLQSMPDTSAGVPYDQHAEEALLGAMMLTEEARHIAMVTVSAADFYVPRHQSIFDAIASVYQRNEPIDTLTIATELANRFNSESAEWTTTLLEFQAGTPAATNAERYAQIVADYAKLRRLLVAGSQVRDIALSQPVDVSGALDAAESLVASATEDTSGRDLAFIGEHVAEARERLARIGRPGEISGQSTGFIDLDRILDGLHPGRLSIVGARPAMG